MFQAVIGAGCLFFQLAACLNVAAPTLNLLPGNLPPDKPKICRRKLARLTFKHVAQTALADNKVTAIQLWSSDDELIIPRLNRACCNLKPMVKIREKCPRHARPVPPPRGKCPRHASSDFSPPSTPHPLNPLPQRCKLILALGTKGVWGINVSKLFYNCPRQV